MTDDTTSLLAAWRRSFEDHDRCPWPGPRPLREGDAGLLAGRSADRERFKRDISNNRLILLHGPSGVGKSSLLRAGLMADLHATGHVPYYADQWGGIQTQGLRAFLAKRLQLPLGESGEDPFRAVDGSDSVLILDQFEELIRYSPSRAADVFDAIVDLNHRSATKIIISFRSEYLHEFADLESRVKNFSTTQFRLDPVADEVAEHVVIAPLRTQRAAVAKDAIRSVAGRVADAWRTARSTVLSESEAADPFNRVGLLHLQALLYTMHFDADGAPLTDEHVEAALARSDHGDRSARAPFRIALQRAVDHKLDHCREAAIEVADGDPRLSRLLVDGTHWSVARTVPHLSSAGYKLIRQAHELAEMALGVDHVALTDGLSIDGPPSDDQMDALFDAVLGSSALGRGPTAGEGSAVDLLEADRATFARMADDAVGPEGTSSPSWCERLEAQPFALGRDRLGVTSGPTMRLNPADAFIEELRRFVFSLVWLHESALVRVTTLPGAGSMISLIHDGFGSALTDWSERNVGRPEGPLSALTSPRGASFGWRDVPILVDRSPRSIDIGGVAEPTVVPNLVWRGGWIRADLDHVTFVNCDFRGLLFDGCLLRGVNFVNCQLDGAIFSDCLIDGPLDTSDEPDTWSDDEPTFVIPAPRGLVLTHAALRGMSDVEPAFLSGLPGSPAIPYRGEPGTERLRHPGSSDDDPPVFGRLDAPLRRGGVTIHGGRISSLVVRGCETAPGSALYLRHTVGSGLDVVEIDDTTFHLQINGSALRQLSISPRAGSTGSIDVEAEGSVLAQLWLAPGLTGTATIRSSRVIHVWNGSEGSSDNGVRLGLEGGVHHGAIGAAIDASNPMGPGVQAIGYADLADDRLLGQMARMDYRRNPAAPVTGTGQ